MTYFISFIVLISLFVFISLIVYLMFTYQWFLYIILGTFVLILLIFAYILIHRSLWGAS